jgi:hypothetical protein
MKSFVYRPRSLRDVACRWNQSREVTDRAPQAGPEEPCGRCKHSRWMHCSIRRSRETREVLFVARSRGMYYWTRTGAYNSRLSGYSLVKCKHYVDGEGWPCCSSSACSCRDCSCRAFLSPYRKKKAPKATGTGTGRKRRRKDSPQSELFAEDATT